MAEPFYITTAISYPNGRPHIGHAYESIATDAIARHQRMRGRDVLFTTGTDEHGLKMAQTARDRGITPRALADEMSSHFLDMANAMNISYDRFIRTTEEAHHIASQAIWQAMVANGDIYLGRYEGWYSLRDEAYYDEKELVDGANGQRLSPQGTPVEWTVEESWFFRLSAYGDKLLNYYEEHPEFIRPESRRNEIMSFVKGGLSDLSISRNSFDWGVAVPNSPGHVMYVWVDALTNYLTSVGYPDTNAADYKKYWPANIHVIGKDIVRFHAVYWPAFLMSAKLPIPKQIFGHGFLLNRGEKMSKSLGNVADPMALADAYGVDQLRYFLLREVSFGQDGSYSDEAIVTRTNAELANSFGNLAQRTLSLIVKNCGGHLPALENLTEDDQRLIEKVRETCITTVPELFDKLAFSQGIEQWLQAVFACNQYVDAQAPWALKKTDPERMKTVLATLYFCIRDLAIVIAPIIPASAANLLGQLGVGEEAQSYDALSDPDWYQTLASSDFILSAPKPVFPRLEMPHNEEIQG